MSERLASLAIALLGLAVWSCTAEPAPDIVECDLGTAPAGSTIEREVEVWNRTHGTWHIGEIRSTCYCLSADVLNRIVSSGDRARFRLHLAMPQEGRHAHDLFVAIRDSVATMVPEVPGGCVTIRVRAIASGLPWTSPSLRILETTSRESEVKIEYSLPSKSLTMPLRTKLLVEQRVLFSIGADLPSIMVMIAEPFVRSDRMVWTATVRIPAMPQAVEAMVELDARLSEPVVSFPVARLRWTNASPRDISLIMRRNSSMTLVSLAAAHGLQIATENVSPSGLPDLDVASTPVTARIVADSVELTSRETAPALGTVVLLREDGTNPLNLNVLVIP